MSDFADSKTWPHSWHSYLCVVTVPSSPGKTDLSFWITLIVVLLPRCLPIEREKTCVAFSNYSFENYRVTQLNGEKLTVFGRLIATTYGGSNEGARVQIGDGHPSQRSVRRSSFSLVRRHLVRPTEWSCPHSRQHRWPRPCREPLFLSSTRRGLRVHLVVSGTPKPELTGALEAVGTGPTERQR